MKQLLKYGTVAAAALLITSNQGWANDGIIFGGLGRDWQVMYDSQNNLLVLLGNDADNEIEVAYGGDGSVHFVTDSITEVSWFKQTPVIAIHGGGGNDIIIGHHLPLLALNGGIGEDTLVWDNGENGGMQNTNIGVGELQECTISKSMDQTYHEAMYKGDLVLWNESTEGGEAVFGGAGLDILIGNTGGDRLQFGDLGNDWLVGGTRVRTGVGSFGNDYLAGGNDNEADDDIVGAWDLILKDL